MGSFSRFSRLFSILVILVGFSLLLVSPALAQFDASQCGLAGPVCRAASPAVAPQISSSELEELLADLRSPAPILDSIIGPCCTGGAAKCPKVTNFRVVGCGADCGTGHSACLYLHN